MIDYLPWDERSIEDQSLFNPAFCSILLRIACKNHAKDASVSLALPLAFLVLPIVLNPKMSAALPTLRTRLTTWAPSNPEFIAGFGDRARDMVNLSREAIQFGVTQKWLAISSAGLSVGVVKFRPDPPKFATDTDDVRRCYDTAKFLGKWFPNDGNPASVMLLLGVAP